MDNPASDSTPPQTFSRRDFVGRSAATAAAGSLALASAQAAETDAPAVRNGRVKQSIVHWCFQKHWTVEQTCQVARQLGCLSVELIDPSHWPLLQRNGLTCAIAGSHSFETGLNNPKYQEMCLGKLRDRISACAEFGVPSVITFTGFREEIADDVGAANCVRALRELAPLAEEKGVNVCLEMLNSRVPEEMKGHPGYQGDHIDYCLEIVKQVDSPRVKLLFDIYHVQIMDGDVIRHLQECAPWIGHVHTAGNPGRRELDDQQEINYPPILRALVEAGYQGYVGQEFIPTTDPLVGLRQAVALCDV